MRLAELTAPLDTLLSASLLQMEYLMGRWIAMRRKFRRDVTTLHKLLNTMAIGKNVEVHRADGELTELKPELRSDLVRVISVLG